MELSLGKFSFDGLDTPQMSGHLLGACGHGEANNHLRITPLWFALHFLAIILVL